MCPSPLLGAMAELRNVRLQNEQPSDGHASAELEEQRSEMDVNR
jgi:hypothetical protein